MIRRMNATWLLFCVVLATSVAAPACGESQQGDEDGEDGGEAGSLGGSGRGGSVTRGGRAGSGGATGGRGGTVGRGGTSTGGVPTGGVSTGGAPTGGTPTGGSPTGGTPTGGDAGEPGGGLGGTTAGRGGGGAAGQAGAGRGGSSPFGGAGGNPFGGAGGRGGAAGGGRGGFSGAGSAGVAGSGGIPCVTIENNSPMCVQTVVGGPNPAVPEGGVIEGGTYHQLAINYYGGMGQSCADTPFSQTWLIVPRGTNYGELHLAQDNVFLFTASLEYTTSGTTLSMRGVCGFSSTYTYQYTAADGAILLFSSDCSTAGQVGLFVLQ